MIHDPDLIDRIAPTRRPPGRAVMRQTWGHLLFLHWEVPADALRALLPPRLELDTFEGHAYVGLVPFTMSGIRPIGLPSFPPLSNFHETNVRTYVHAHGRDPGVWFFSLDAANVVGAALGRSWFRLPYFFARMGLDVAEVPGGSRLTYASRRIYPGPRPAVSRIVAEVRSPAKSAVPGSLEHFLAERYVLYARAGSGLRLGRVHHSPYPLQMAEVEALDESLLAASGIARPDGSPLAHYSRGVDVEVFSLGPVLARARDGPQGGGSGACVAEGAGFGGVDVVAWTLTVQASGPSLGGSAIDVA